MKEYRFITFWTLHCIIYKMLFNKPHWAHLLKNKEN